MVDCHNLQFAAAMCTFPSESHGDREKSANSGVMTVRDNGEQATPWVNGRWWARRSAAGFIHAPEAVQFCRAHLNSPIPDR